MVRRFRYRSMLLGLVGLACAGTNAAPPSEPEAVKLDAVPSAAPVEEPLASADAPPPGRVPPPAPSAPPSDTPTLDPAVLEAEAATPVPDAPSKLAVSGAAALVWVDDDKAERRIKSVLIEPSAGKARVVAERKEPVFVGKGELWVIREKKLASKACDECELCLTDPPTCKKNRTIDIAEPFLRSLKSGKTFEPWQRGFASRTGCSAGIGEHDSELSLEGGAGSYYFFTVHNWDQGCGGAHPMFSDEAVTVDLDTGKVGDLAFPQQPLEALRKRAHAELVQSCTMDAKEQPTDYRMTASYAPNGELQGVFGFTMSAPYVCGTGPGHYSALSEQVSGWVPRELERWGKLPDWVAGYLASVGAKFAVMLDATRFAGAKRELKQKR